MTPVKFTKLHGTGNDFVLLDGREHRIGHADAVLMAKEICPRRTGIGADGLLLLESDPDTDFRMKHYNPDGTRSSFCGNGARCMVLYAAEKGLFNDACTIHADDGVHSATIAGEQIRLAMAAPGDTNLNQSLTIDGADILVHSINTGTQHTVTFTRGLDDFPIASRGREIRFHRHFQPDGTNVNFVEQTGPTHVSVRTYERGVEAETLSCGTGVVAAAVISAKKGLTTPPVSIATRGGDLVVDFNLSGASAREVYLTGPARFVFTGEFQPTL